MITLFYVAIAINYTATTYGFGEKMCGDVGKPVKCDSNAITASGTPFDPEALTAAVPMPNKYRLKKEHVWLYSEFQDKCIKVKINDKKNPRYIGNSGLDITPALQEALFGTRNWFWSGELEVCETEALLSQKIEAYIGGGA
jgi:hypothetical protein